MTLPEKAKEVLSKAGNERGILAEQQAAHELAARPASLIIACSATPARHSSRATSQAARWAAGGSLRLRPGASAAVRKKSASSSYRDKV